LNERRSRTRTLLRAAIGTASIVLVAVPSVRALSSVGCRAGIERSMRRMSTTALKTIDRCHAERNSGRSSVDTCNVLSDLGGSPWSRQANRTDAFVRAKCAADDEAVRQNYPPCDGDGCDNIEAAIVPATQATIQVAAGEVTDESTLRGNAARCQRAITRAQKRVALHVLEQSMRCQRRLDDERGQTDFGPIDEKCLAVAGSSGQHGLDKIARACRGLTGADVGSCDPLPDCVVTVSQTLGQDLARSTYGEPSACGDGTQDPIEECDDGNTVPTDACTDTCRDAVCGDGITWEGVEECDDANDIRTDDCDACKLPVCGDGIRAGDEECDDDNDVPDDGCTNCIIDAVLCGPGGMRATVVYDDPESTLAAAGRMQLAYPPAVSIPGSGAASSVRLRVVNASSASNPLFLVSDNDTNADSVDDRLTVVFGLTEAWPVGPFATITFDCAVDAPVRAPDFICAFDDASDASTNPVDPAALFCAVTVLEPIP
jgi:cysteine-rich repeat protein